MPEDICEIFSTIAGLDISQGWRVMLGFYIILQGGRHGLPHNNEPHSPLSILAVD